MDRARKRLISMVNVFVRVQENGIGQTHALFYEAYAAFLEMKGNYPTVGAIYQEGIDR